MAPREGFEPPTNRLTADRSTTELPRNMRAARQGSGPGTRILGGSPPLVNLDWERVERPGVRTWGPLSNIRRLADHGRWRGGSGRGEGEASLAVRQQLGRGEAGPRFDQERGVAERPDRGRDDHAIEPRRGEQGVGLAAG